MICSESKNCSEFRLDGISLCNEKFKQCIHYQFLKEKKALPDPEIISLDTWTITAQTVYDEKGQARVEISEYLKEYPELYQFCLKKIGK